MTDQQRVCDMPEAHHFDFIVGEWQILNKMRNPQGEWVEFPATDKGEKYLDGCTIIDHYEATFPDGTIRKGITIRAFDHQTRQWSLVWLDNRNPPDFRPLVGEFKDGIGLFYQQLAGPDGATIHVRFMWDNISDTTARWQQAFSHDGGQTWNTNWIMEFTR